MATRKPGEKPGRNQPCWCGSGKKYKFCHMRQDREDTRRQTAAQGAPPPSPVEAGAAVAPQIEAATSQAPPPDPSELVMAEARWERFQAADLETRIDIWQEALATGELDEESAFEMLTTIRDEMDTAHSSQDRARYAELVDQLRCQAPDLYRHDMAYYHENLIRDVVTEGRWEALPDLLAPFAEMPKHGIDIFFRLIDVLRYHGQIAPLIQVMQQAWPRVADSDEITPWGIEEFGLKLSVLILFDYLETAKAPRADDPILLEACAPYGRFDPDWLDMAIRHLSEAGAASEAGRSAWQPADFAETMDADQWEENLRMLLFDFVADRHRHGVPFTRADLPRSALFDLLREQLVTPAKQDQQRSRQRRQRKKKSKKRSDTPLRSSLLPRYAALEKTLAGMFGFLGGEPYKAGALAESIPPYVHFLARLGLIHPTKMDGALSSLRPLATQFVTVLENYGADSRMIEIVQLAWSDETLAALQDDPALAEARARAPVVVAPPPPPTRRPGALQTYTFKVTYLRDPDVWRKIEISENQTLDDLHYAIQKTVRFDDDHLYSFYLSGRAWDSDTEYASPHTGERRSAAKIKIRDLSLRGKQRFLYLFDYGDEHHFEVQLIDVNLDAPKDARYPRVVERHGKNPSQYGWE